MRFFEPLLFPFFAFASGILLHQFIDLTLLVAGLAAAAFLLLSFSSRFSENHRLCSITALFFFCFCGISYSIWRSPAQTPELDADPQEIILLSGCIVEPPRLMNDREQFVMELAPGARARVNQYFKPEENPPLYQYGQTVAVEGRARPPRNYGNEGAFDIETFLAARQIYWTVTARTVEIKEGTCGNAVMRSIYHLRAVILNRINSLFGADEAPKVAALLIGESARLDRQWTDNFRRTGTYHALVVSGTHVTLVAGALILMLRCFFIGELTALFLTSFATWIYAIIAGGTPPAMRAAAGFTLFLICRFFYRKARLLNILAAVAWLFVLFDPQSIFDASFQLSFGAVMAIGAIALPLDTHLFEPFRKGLRRLNDQKYDIRLEPHTASFRVELRLIAETISLALKIPFRYSLLFLQWILTPVFSIIGLLTISAAVQLMLALLFVIYFHRYAFTALAANLGVVLLLEAAIVTGFFALSGWQPLVWLTTWLIDHSAQLADFHASWEPSLRIPGPPLWVISIVILSLCALAWSYRKWRLIFPATGAAFAALALLLVHPFSPATESGSLELTAIDVGQGDALLIVFPDGSRMAVDGGGIPHFGSTTKPMDIGEGVVSPYLWSRSIRSLNIVALTHGHADHMDGIAALIENFQPKEFWISGQGKSPELDQLLSFAEAHGVRIRKLQYGDQFNQGGASITVVSPPPGMENTGAPRNNDSLGFKINFGNHAFLLAGDAERRIEDELAFDPSIGKIDVLKVSHHGGRTSTTEALLQRTQPAFALISAGLWNRYGHPHPEVLERLSLSKTAVLRTDRDGRITIRSNGKQLAMETYKWTQTR